MVMDPSEDRIGKIGGSDIPAILGQDKYTTPYQAWRKIKGLDVVEDNEHMQRGRACEPAILTLLEPRFREVRKLDRIYHPDKPWLMASVDAVGVIASDSLVPIECKAPASYDGTPRESYVTQVEHYNGMLREAFGGGIANYNLIAVLCGQLHVHTVDFNPERYEATLWQVENWYKTHILGDTPPPLSTDEDVAIAHPESRAGKAHYGDKEDMNVFQQLHHLRHQRDKLEADISALEVAIKSTMGDAEEFWVGDDRLATFKSQTKDSLDTKRLKQEHPDIAEAYTKRSSYRVFRLKGVVTP